MPRLKPLLREQVPAVLEHELDAISQANGYVPNSMLIMARRPEITKHVLALIRSIMRNPESTIDAGLRWMIAHVCSNSNGCQYCMAHTLKNGTHYGLAQQKMDALWEYQSNALFSPAERAALNVAIGGGQAPADVSDAEMDELKKYYSEEQIVEIVLVISLFGFNNRWNSIMQTDLEPTVVNFVESNEQAFAHRITTSN